MQGSCDHINTRNNAAGFSLVELSIVLVIIALIIGGVMGGQSLIASSRLQKISTQMTGYLVAINNFKLQYDAVPGDFKDAHSYWGSNCAGLAHRCNGDGNGQIDQTCSGTCVTYYQEPLVAWKHLSLAGVINGLFSGSSTPVGASFLYSDFAININAPKGSIDGTGYELMYDTTFSKNMLRFGTVPVGSYYLRGGAITPKEAASIDKKIDDGLADKGKLRAMSTWTSPSCTTSNTYTISSTASSCSIGLMLE